MEIYNCTVYHNFISDQWDVWMNDRHGKRIQMKLLAEFDDLENALEQTGTLSYGLFIREGSASKFAGRILFPWLGAWKYEGHYFNEEDLKEICKQIYYWIGLWD